MNASPSPTGAITPRRPSCASSWRAASAHSTPMSAESRRGSAISSRRIRTWRQGTPSSARSPASAPSTPQHYAPASTNWDASMPSRSPPLPASPPSPPIADPKTASDTSAADAPTSAKLSTWPPSAHAASTPTSNASTQASSPTENHPKSPSPPSCENSSSSLTLSSLKTGHGYLDPLDQHHRCSLHEGGGGGGLAGGHPIRFLAGQPAPDPSLPCRGVRKRGPRRGRESRVVGRAR